MAANQPHPRECFCCQRCRVEGLNNVMTEEENEEEEFFQEFFRVIPRQLNQIHERHFKKMKRMVLYGNALRIKSLHNTGYTSYGAWLAHSHPDLSLDERQEKCNKINWAKNVFEKWDNIVHNMSNPLYVNIDIRRLSLQQLNRARKDNWCKEENRRQAPREERTVPTVPNFSMVKIDNIFESIIESQIVDDVSGDEDQLKLISKMLLDKMKNLRVYHQ